jgi:beta-mannosidase
LKFDKTFCVLKVNYGENEYLHYFAKPKGLKLKKDKIQIEIEKKSEGYLVILSSKTLQKNVFLMTNGKGKFDDNYFDLLPNIPKHIFFSTESENTPKIKFKTLNQFISK